MFYYICALILIFWIALLTILSYRDKLDADSVADDQAEWRA